jgi:hypothetical protein
MRTRAYRSHRNHPALPAQWFTTYTCPPRRPGFLATVAPEKLSPPRNLTPASGCQDHTTSSSASGTLVRRTLRVHRSPPRERNDRDSPLWWDGMVRNMDLFWVFCKSEYFFKRGLTGSAGVLPVGQNQPTGKHQKLGERGVFLIPPPCGEGGAKRRVGVSARQCANNYFAEATPHPTGLLPATLPTTRVARGGGIENLTSRNVRARAVLRFR